jgi:SagB-type dehydrogenase family enzyme
LVCEGGRLVWDDYLEHRQYALAQGVEQVLGWFAGWRELDSLADRPRWRRTAEALADRGVLVAENSPRHLREQEIQQTWGRWGPHTRAYHFSTRSHRDTPYLSMAEDGRRLATKLREDPPVSAFLAFADAPVVRLPAADEALIRHRDIVDVLRRRRSHRTFGRASVTLPVLATLLGIAGRPIPHRDGRLATESQSVFKTSPSGGARHPTEIYLYPLRVEGLEPVLYHYSCHTHCLENLQRTLSPDELILAVGDQDWVADANLVLFYTSVLARTAWKYDMGRVYRALMLDVGHLSQTVYLLATALGLRTTFTAALRDELVERFLDRDPIREIVVGASVIGAGDP